MANVVPWSYSSLTAFETCPKRFQLTRLLKKVVEPSSEAMTHGNEVHKALELATLGEKPLADKYKQYQPLVQMLRSRPGKRLVEYKFGLTKGFQPTTFFAKDVWVRGVIDYALVQPAIAFVLDHKGLPLDTKLPTPTGWTTIGDVKVGDFVFGRDGKPCRVTAKSTVHNRKCYQVRFDDGTGVVCDDEHLWPVNGAVLDTETIASSLVKYGQKWRTVPIASALELPDMLLPIDPYVLGCWLGDGKHTSGEICKPDGEFWENIKACGFEVSEYTQKDRCRSGTVRGLRTLLRENKLLGNKHIPESYFRASYAQRLALLRGLYDSDGSANHTRKSCVFASCDKELAAQVEHLLRTLGQRPHNAEMRAYGFGKETTVWQVSFRPQNIQPFTLTRKAVKVKAEWGPGNSNRRVFVSVDEVPAVDTQCISVDSSDQTYLCTEEYLVTHNTGKPKPDHDQLKLFAGVTFAAFPYVEKVHTGYLWLAYNKMDSQVFTKEDLPGIWGDFGSRVQRMEHAFQTDNFPPKPSGLCRAWCPVPRSLCEFSGRN